MAGIASIRLNSERRKWRRDHPAGFIARPRKKSDDSLDLMFWECIIPGKKDTIWEHGQYPLTMAFSEDYPMTPPKCQFDSGFFHPNIYPSGTVCLSILDADKNWRAGITIKDILLGIQDLLDNPNNNDPAQAEVHLAYSRDPDFYRIKVLAQARKYTPSRS